MFRRLWADDTASVIATEYVLLASVVTFGAAAGLVAIRNAVNENLADVGRSIRAVGVVPAAVRKATAFPVPPPIPTATTAAVVADYRPPAP